MKEKNGFIATSVLYAFLIAFLTLFLGFMADYIQNKQLIRRIEDMALEELNKYGKAQLSDLKVGDYIVFDTIENEGEAGTNATFSSLTDASAKWILYNIEEKAGADEDNVYYFVSASDAQKFSYVTTAVNPEGAANIDYLERKILFSNLGTVSQIINGNVYYDNNTKIYRAYDESHTNNSYDNFKKVYTYQFSYSLNSGINVRLMTSDDISDINDLDNEKIKASIFGDKVSFAIWNAGPPTSTDLNKKGFYYMNYRAFNKGDDSSVCDSSTVGYSHDYTSNGETYRDYCYYTDESSYLSSCLGTQANDSVCRNNGKNYSPKLIATIKVNSSSDVKNGYFDSGNGTFEFPYLLTKGAK